jgi:uncharacterized membrane protein YraQ (UPF0718 family)
MSKQESVERAQRSGPVVVAVFAVVSLAGLLWAKWWPYGHKVGGLLDTRHWSGSSVLDAGSGPGTAPSWEGAWRFAVSYGQSVWMALVAALLIAAAVEAFLPRRLLSATLGHRSGWATSAVAGGLALPFMMCTCCTAPITNALRRRGVPASSAIAFWLGNPVLNPAVLVFLVLTLPWQYTAVRLGVGALLVFGLSPLLGRFGAREVDAVAIDPTVADAQPIEPPISAWSGLARFARALGRFAVVLVPEYVLLVLVVGGLRGWMLPLTQPGATVVVATVIAAVAGTLLVIPTAGEIPVIAGLAAAGFAPSVTGALLIALPAISLPSMVMVGRALSWKRTIATALAVCGCALVASVLCTALR